MPENYHQVIAEICDVTRTIVFVAGLFCAVKQWQRINRNTKLDVYRNIRDAYCASNLFEAGNTEALKMMGQTAEHCFLHNLLAQYEYVWRCSKIGDLTPEELERYQIAVDRMREKLKVALDSAIHPFDPEFAEYVRTGTGKAGKQAHRV